VSAKQTDVVVVAEAAGQKLDAARLFGIGTSDERLPASGRRGSRLAFSG